MPVPISNLKVRSDSQRVKFLTIFGRPKTCFFDQISGVPGRAPLATNHAVEVVLTYRIDFKLHRNNGDWIQATGAAVGDRQPGHRSVS